VLAVNTVCWTPLGVPLWGRVLTEKGEVYARGRGKLGTEDTQNRLTPIKITLPVVADPIEEISAGFLAHLVCLHKNGCK
jgi:hypothetical protein